MQTEKIGAIARKTRISNQDMSAKAPLIRTATPRAHLQHLILQPYRKRPHHINARIRLNYTTRQRPLTPISAQAHLLEEILDHFQRIYLARTQAVFQAPVIQIREARAKTTAAVAAVATATAIAQVKATVTVTVTVPRKSSLRNPAHHPFRVPQKLINGIGGAERL